MWLQIETQCNTFLSVVRKFLEREGLYIEDSFVIQRPKTVCVEMCLILVYYIISLFLLWVDVISFWTLILNSICLARAITKTTLKTTKYLNDLEHRTNKDCLNAETKFFLDNYCTAYNKARIRESVFGVVIALTALVIIFGTLQTIWIAPFMRFASSVALLGAALDDMLSDAEGFFEAHPPFPNFNG